jgi:hypothetical protein
MIRIAIRDDYQNASLEMADWSPLAGRAVITVFNDHLSNLVHGNHSCEMGHGAL